MSEDDVRFLKEKLIAVLERVERTEEKVERTAEKVDRTEAKIDQNTEELHAFRLETRGKFDGVGKLLIDLDHRTVEMERRMINLDNRTRRIEERQDKDRRK